MTTRKMLTAACALALGVAWTMAPAVAADDTAKDKMERAKDKTENKAEDVKDKTKEKAVEVKDKIKEKVSGRKNGTTVAKGSDDVRQAQQALTDKGFNPGTVDGKMGPHTKAALTDFQKKENLKVTGRLDRETKDRLIGGSMSGKAESTPPAASPSTTSSAPASPAAPPASPPDQNPTKKQTQ